MARNKKKPIDQDPPIQFRAGESMMLWLRDFAERRRLSINEVAKRFVILARHGLDVRYFDSMSDLANELGGERSVVEAATMVYMAVQLAERDCAAAGERLTAEEREKTIEQTIANQILNRRMQRLEAEDEEEEKKRIRIHLTRY
jgi:hypothetical protein